MSHSWAKNRATSRRAGSRRDVTESKIGDVATCGATSRRDRGHYQMTSRREKSTSRRDREPYKLTSRRDITRRDVTDEC